MSTSPDPAPRSHRASRGRAAARRSGPVGAGQDVGEDTGEMEPVTDETTGDAPAAPDGPSEHEAPGTEVPGTEAPGTDGPRDDESVDTREAEEPQPPEAPEPPTTGAARLRRALWHPGRGQVVVGVLLALVAFGGVVQVRSTDSDDDYAGYREEDLVNVLSGLAGASRRARSEINRLETARDQLESDTDAEQAALDQALSQADTLAILAGSVPVTGPGIRITITEQSGTVRSETLVNMVQALRVAGAEAMQFNGQVRLVAQSAFTDTSTGVSIDGTTLRSPYVVDVIGSPSALSGAMSILEGPRVDLQDDGASVDITEVSSLDIESTTDVAGPDYADPADDQ
ncbi:DUF881 domain-containing protein [Nocardioides bruguierae]|uniref:DUF881 domain-containing protein n=1 Tax=Nocardioides bruguierae TaxID=2945102 RepID=UPI0020208897|nr:DUF881 domain-containing protein [Nocardioides bruguierae]MCL8025957.1 DUF881 domain-containing protein [Nocardioides bruguierae]